jgi:hypothetical protein
VEKRKKRTATAACAMVLKIFHGKEFLSFAQTMKRRVVEDDTSVELLKMIKSFMSTLLKHTALAGTVPISSPEHIFHPLLRHNVAEILFYASHS